MKDFEYKGKVYKTDISLSKEANTKQLKTQFGLRKGYKWAVTISLSMIGIGTLVWLLFDNIWLGLAIGAIGLAVDAVVSKSYILVKYEKFYDEHYGDE